jgi:hypothetical protein
MTTPPPYRVLDVDPSASQAEVRKAYQEALRARAFSRQEITQAFNQLRNPRSRLDADLVELPSTAGPEQVDVRSGRSPVDAAAAAFPAWRDLVVPGAPGPWPEVAAPSEPFLAAGTDRPSAAVLPPVDFEV